MGRQVDGCPQRSGAANRRDHRFLPDTFLGLLLEKAEALCAVLSPRRNTLCQHWVGTQCGQGTLRRTARSDTGLGDILLHLTVSRKLWYIVFQSYSRGQEFSAEIGVSVFGCRSGCPFKISDRP